jgi:hypothetical protein
VRQNTSKSPIETFFSFKLDAYCVKIKSIFALRFAVQGAAAEQIYASMGKTPEQMGATGNLGVEKKLIFNFIEKVKILLSSVTRFI